MNDRVKCAAVVISMEKADLEFYLKKMAFFIIEPIVF